MILIKKTEEIFPLFIKSSPLNHWISFYYGVGDFIPNISLKGNYFFFLKDSKEHQSFIEELYETYQKEKSFKFKDLPFLIEENENKIEIKLSKDYNFTKLHILDDFVEISSILTTLQYKKLFSRGIILKDSLTCQIHPFANIGNNCVIGANVLVCEKSMIGNNSLIENNAIIRNSTIRDNCLVLANSIIEDSVIEDNSSIGPFARLRNGVNIRKDSKVGNFVEMKKTDFGPNSKAMHLSYLGDSQILEKVNIGAGTITCNYDGKNKHKTTIKKGVFVGSGTELVAPLTLEDNCVVGAGSTISKNVEKNALALSREKTRIIKNWSKK